MIEHPYHPKAHTELEELWLAHRLASSIKVYPTIWRSRLLLSSRVWEPEHDTRIWLSAEGQISAFAMLWRRSQTSPFLVLDHCIHPEEVTEALFLAILQWGVQRARLIAKQQKTSLTLFARELGSVESNHLFENRGFKLHLTDDQDKNLYFVHSLKAEIIPQKLPTSFSIQQLQSSEDLETYKALYNFAEVDPHHLEEQLASEEYSHFVIANPEGKYIAYSETSISRAEWDLSGQCIGWIDYIGTRPKDRRQGFGQALLRHSLQKLQKQGAEEARLVTISSNLPAVNFYSKAGFRQEPVQEPASYQIKISVK